MDNMDNMDNMEPVRYREYNLASQEIFGNNSLEGSILMNKIINSLQKKEKELRKKYINTPIIDRGLFKDISMLTGKEIKKAEEYSMDNLPEEDLTVRIYEQSPNPFETQSSSGKFEEKIKIKNLYLAQLTLEIYENYLESLMMAIFYSYAEVCHYQAVEEGLVHDIHPFFHELPLFYNGAEFDVRKMECVCPQCKRTVIAMRLAPHLEKCMGRGRNSSRLANKLIASKIRNNLY